MRSRWDWLLFSQILALGSISILIIASINQSLAKTQMIFWLIGLSVLFLISRFDYRNWLNYSKIFYAFCLTTLVLVLLLGESVQGSVRWINLGFFKFQPSELTKAAVILTLASFYNEKSAKIIKNLLLSFLIILPAVFLIFLQPDIGNTFALIAIWLGISFASGLKFKHVIILLAVSLAFFFLLFQILAPYQRERLESFISPLSDPLGTGYNIIQSKIAIGSGLITGRGWGHGSQSQLKFLPESESDFIFASISEQLGLVGASLTLVLFTWLIFRIVSDIQGAERFGQLILFGTASYFLAQFLVNVGMNLGLLPVTGITFPLISYGGSSLTTNLFVLGIIFSIVKRAK